MALSFLSWMEFTQYFTSECQNVSCQGYILIKSNLGGKKEKAFQHVTHMCVVQGLARNLDQSENYTQKKSYLPSPF